MRETTLIRREAVRELASQGFSTRSIAAQLGMGRRTVQRDRVALGIPSKPPPRPLTAEEVAKAQAMLADGCSCLDVARTLGRTHKTILSRFREHVWTPTQIGQYARMVGKLNQIEAKTL